MKQRWSKALWQWGITYRITTISCYLLPCFCWAKPASVSHRQVLWAHRAQHDHSTKSFCPSFTCWDEVVCVGSHHKALVELRTKTALFPTIRPHPYHADKVSVLVFSLCSKPYTSWEWIYLNLQLVKTHNSYCMYKNTCTYPINVPSSPRGSRKVFSKPSLSPKSIIFTLLPWSTSWDAAGQVFFI